MMNQFYKHCDALLRVLPEKIIMEQWEVASFLGVSDEYASCVIEQLRNDKLADGSGFGPVSRNNRTSSFPNFYKDKIKELKANNRTKTYAHWGFWLGVIGMLMQIVQLTMKVI